jgi:predicted esterase
MSEDPHRNQPVLQKGVPLEKATGLLILLHGRGASADDILSLWPYFSQPGIACLAPQAASYAWYPDSFLAPVENNQPWLNSALAKIETLVQSGLDAGLTTDRIAIGGFSQGACLTTEFVATHPARYAAIIAFTGGLIGPLDSDVSHSGDLQETPVFFGSGDPDPHVPWVRVQQSADIFKGMNASVTLRRYPGKPHSVSPEELGIALEILKNAFPVA